ncbi:MAG: N-(5'-phosphoribosyl)anthranilate isomerase [Candidatus Dormibacteria bacterium]
MIVKVCGVRSAAIAAAAVEEGADWIGVVLVPGSVRGADLAMVAEVRAAIAGEADLVGVFVDADAATCNRAAARLGLDAVQLHGRADAGMAAGLDVPVIRGINVEVAEAAYRDQWWPAPLLVDAANRPGELPGGTGRAAPLELATELARHRRVVLAGGLNAARVGRAVATVRPWGVDASSQLESAPGVKDEARVRAYVRSARRALSALTVAGTR